MRLRGRDRTHQFPGRDERIAVRLTSAEKALLEAAATRVGMTPTGYVAEAALAAAADSRPARLDPHREALCELQAALFAVRAEVQHIGVNLNQAVAAFHRTGQAPAWLEQVSRRCERRLAGVEQVIARVDQELR
ncbi:hypothetical protein L3i22_060770 [Actinoplanes sp. L3-i22]|nr:hypothetical protein L3i22_060770 [Actinoplanes sp. L3-i22]